MWEWRECCGGGHPTHAFTVLWWTLNASLTQPRTSGEQNLNWGVADIRLTSGHVSGDFPWLMGNFLVWWCYLKQHLTPRQDVPGCIRKVAEHESHACQSASNIFHGPCPAELFWVWSEFLCHMCGITSRQRGHIRFSWLSQAPATVASLRDGLTVTWNCKPNRLSCPYFVFGLKCVLSQQ